MEELPVTEVSSQFTVGLDRVGGGCEGVVRMLRQADGQLWAGYGAHPGIYDKSVLQSLEQLAECFFNVLQSPREEGAARTVAVLSGCGTSGRMAYLAACLFNQYMEGAEGLPPSKRPFRYLISGGDRSLVLSQELPEDDPKAGAQDLDNCVKDLPQGSTVIVVGITCGISAPYVLGQLKHALTRSSKECRFVPALIGFNPCRLARHSPVENWPFTCRDVALYLEDVARSRPGDAIVLNPVLGPEAVTGSSRMKGGTATKVLLDAAFFHALGRSKSKPVALLDILEAYEHVHRRAYHPVEALAEAMAAAGASLQSSGHLYYVGAGAVGKLGFIDASEMFDTYGESFESVQGFMKGGWDNAGTNEGDLSAKEKLLCLSWSAFEKKILGSLRKNDTIVVASTPSQQEHSEWLSTVLSRLSATDAKIVRVTVGREGGAEPLPVLNGDAVAVHVSLRHVDVCHLGAGACAASPLADLAVKYVFNAISTAACVVKGLVYSNRMINMGISNNKLFFRAIRIIQGVSNVTEEEARECLLCAIHGLERNEVRRRQIEVSEWQTISHHVIVATPKALVLPHAILLASSSSLTYAAAHAALERDPLLRTHIPARPGTSC